MASPGSSGHVGQEGAVSRSQPGKHEQSAAVEVSFVDEAAEAGLMLMNVSGTIEKRSILETTGAGACFLDYDRDGDLDLYIVNGSTTDVGETTPRPSDAQYRNDGHGQFTEVTSQVGIADKGWGGGCAVADYDNDGDPDLYVTNYGANVLYRNEGNGKFHDVTATAGVGDDRWSLGAAFVDVDRDGNLDLYVANYLEFAPEDTTVRFGECRWKGIPVMCGPRGFGGQPDTLYHNNGDGTFTDISEQAGIRRSALFGMGVVAGDIDADGDVDIFVANDSQENHLFLNDGHGRFSDIALTAGVALSGDGRQQASMGADLGDYDNDGDEDLYITNFSDDYHTLYRNEGSGQFTDVTSPAGLDAPTRSSLGWGTGFFDYDNDGDLDLFAANGHVYPQVDGKDLATSYRQQNLLFRNDGNGRFSNVTGQSGPGMLPHRTGRGVAFGDYDDDGDMDVVVVNENDGPTLLRNDGGNALNWLKVRLIGAQSNRDGIGARLALRVGGRVQFREARLNGGYCSSHDPRFHFGLATETVVDQLDIRWPSGKRQVFTGVRANHVVTIHEENGIVDAVPLRNYQTSTVAKARHHSPRPAVSTPLDARAPVVPAPTGGRLSRASLRQVDALVQTGTHRILAGQYQQGIEGYLQALRHLPPWEEAAKTPDALGFGNPERYRTYLASLYDNLGVALMRAERTQECTSAIERSIMLLSTRAKSHYNLGLCHFHGRRYGEAVAAFRAAKLAGFTSPNLNYDLGRSHALAGDCKEAAEELRLALERLRVPDLHGRRAEAWYYLGVCHADLGKDREAANDFREVLSMVPGHQKALYKLILTFRKLGQAEAADQAQNLFQARLPMEAAVRSQKLAGVNTVQERLHLARLCQQASLPRQGLFEAQMAFAANPFDTKVLTTLGQLYLSLRPPALSEAEAAFQKALQQDAGLLEAMVGLGETYRLANRTQSATDVLTKAATLQPDNVLVIVPLARTLFLAGKTSEAVNALNAILRENPYREAALRALAEIYARASGPYDRPQEALRILHSLPSLYGEDVETKLYALSRLRRFEEARNLLETSPFLGAEKRSALRSLAQSQ